MTRAARPVDEAGEARDATLPVVPPGAKVEPLGEGYKFTEGPAEGPDGRIYVIYDRDRYGAKEILMAVFTEEDVAKGECVSKHARLKVLVNNAGQK